MMGQESRKEARSAAADQGWSALPEAGYVVTRSRPYPEKVVADSGWRLGKAFQVSGLGCRFGGGRRFGHQSRDLHLNLKI